MKTYAWLASESAPKGYPMKVIFGSFIFPDGKVLNVPPNKIIQKGWGRPVSTHIVGDELKPLPNQLTIAFFSYTEDKFYAGEFELPYDRLCAAFAKGEYDRITAGVAPGGAVAVWMVGVDKTTELWFGQAVETELDFERVAGQPEEKREGYVRDKLEELLSDQERAALRHEGVPTGRWEQFREPYPWSPVCEGLAPLRIGPIKFFNGEIDSLEYPLPDPMPPLPVPGSLEFKVVRKGQRSLRYLLTFDRQEISSGFTHLAQADKAMELAMVAGTSGFSVCLRNEDESIALPKTRLVNYLGL